MSIKIEIECCGGEEQYKDHCLRDRCPIYKAAHHKVSSNWPYVGTGFGNLYGWPEHGDYLRQVKRDIQNESKKVE